MIGLGEGDFKRAPGIIEPAFNNLNAGSITAEV